MHRLGETREVRMTVQRIHTIVPTFPHAEATREGIMPLGFIYEQAEIVARNKVNIGLWKRKKCVYSMNY